MACTRDRTDSICWPEMPRRTFLGTMAGALLVAPRAVRAQPPARPATIGVLASSPLTEAVQEALRDGLREQGYVEGRNIVIEWRFAEGRRDRADALAIELARLKVDVIVALLTPAALAAKNATSTIPIVMAPAGDPIASGLVASLARPGGNVTGVTGIGAELAGKQLEALRQVVPRFTRLALLIHPFGDTFSKTLTEQTQAAAKRSGIRLHVVSVPDPEDLERAFATMAAQHDEGRRSDASRGRASATACRRSLPRRSSPKPAGCSRTERARSRWRGGACSTWRESFAAPGPAISRSSSPPGSSSSSTSGPRRPSV